MGSYRISLHNLGCRVNRVELDSFAAQLVGEGCIVVGERQAQLIIVNTCAVTGEAEAKARKAVRHAALLPQHPVVLATGCVASLFADELETLGDNVFVESVKANVCARALSLLKTSSLSLDAVQEIPCNSQASLQRAVTPTGRMRPGIKIQDGCDNRCTYCIVWKARGRATSVDVATVIGQIDALIKDGAQEVVLTGIDLGRYSSDGIGLTQLIRTILNDTEIGRVRISSIEPAGVTPELMEVIASSEGRVAPFLHIPLQSGCNETLQRMARPYTVEDYLCVVDMTRTYVPNLALACDLIVGFPGETDKEFATSLSTCEQIGFANMHVFRYSKRPGTPAAVMQNQVAPEVSAERSRQMRSCALTSRRSYIQSFVGSDELVLVEGKGLGVTGGLVECLVDEGLEGQLVKLKAHSVSREGLLDMRTSHIG